MMEFKHKLIHKHKVIEYQVSKYLVPERGKDSRSRTGTVRAEDSISEVITGENWGMKFSSRLESNSN